MRNLLNLPALVIVASLMLVTPATARQSSVRPDAVHQTASSPAYCVAEHNVGKLVLSVSNNGTIGTGFGLNGWLDCFTGHTARSCECPKGSGSTYLCGAALWIGALVDGDTLVSVGADGWTPAYEMHPDESPTGDMQYRSTSRWCSFERYGAVSEQDYIAVCTDTFTSGVYGLTADAVSGRPHWPLHVEVTTASHAWSWPELEDFVLLDYTIRNIGSDTLRDVYVGMYTDADVTQTGGDVSGIADDVSGFIRAVVAETGASGCPADSEILNLAYTADNDGELASDSALPHVAGLFFLQTPTGSSDVSFNWWQSNPSAGVSDFGPQRRASYREFVRAATGTPEGDANKYFMMATGGIDYDQVFTGVVGAADPVWVPADSTTAASFCLGGDTRFLLSTGGFTLLPGDSVRFSIAYVAGENLHRQASNFGNLPSNPQAYMNNLDFSDLVVNARWAKRIFDVPGFDTDGDGYAGEFRLCDGDTTWVSGDGIPDYAADAPPPAPVVRATPLENAVKVQWNGYRSQTAREPLFDIADFEGFAVYLSTVSDGFPGTFAKVASFDVEDFRKYVWDAALPGWRYEPRRFMLDELLCLYAPRGCTDGLWHPLQFPRQAPYVSPANPDSVFYFEQVYSNACAFGVETPIVRSYPDAPKPPYESPEDVPADSMDYYLTSSGDFRYYEYELTITNLLPGQEYMVAVTAFDHGPLTPTALPLESCPYDNGVAVSPLGACCADPTRGNVDESADGAVTIGDLTVMIEHLFVLPSPFPCLEAANLDLSTDDLVTMGDLTVLIDHLFISLSPLPACP